MPIRINNYGSGYFDNDCRPDYFLPWQYRVPVMNTRFVPCLVEVEFRCIGDHRFTIGKSLGILCCLNSTTKRFNFYQLYHELAVRHGKSELFLMRVGKAPLHHRQVCSANFDTGI